MIMSRAERDQNKHLIGDVTRLNGLGWSGIWQKILSGLSNRLIPRDILIIKFPCTRKAFYKRFDKTRLTIEKQTNVDNNKEEYLYSLYY